LLALADARDVADTETDELREAVVEWRDELDPGLSGSFA
jgi:hypothetical protein